MGIIDFILNLAGLLLWLNWRSLRFDPLAKRTPATLMGTLRPASPERLRRWHLLLFIAVLLLVRALLYRWIGPMFPWVAKLDLGVVILPFRSDSFPKILTFSCFSFGLALGTFYVWLLLLSLLKGPDPIHRLVKIPLGRVDDWPNGVKIVLPFLITALGWLLASWLCVWLQVIPPSVSVSHRLWESLIIGLTSYISWMVPLYAILLLHLLSSYIYFGQHPFWNYNTMIARKILAPLKALPLRIGRVDFAPALAMVAIFFAGKYALIGLTRLFAH
ncbi:MAG TPA: hypothetical protein VGO57_08720 [Verrucomicrobiae bacterium]|jgi:uncharacterized protein YggT (Ycf19 family)